MRDRGSVVVALACTAALAVVVGCAAPGPDFDGQRYRVPDHPSSIEPPGGEGAAWRLTRVRGAALAFRGEAGTTAESASMSLLERCAAASLNPRVAARQLLIGLGEREFQDDRAVEVAGAPGWLQALEASDAAGRVHLRTVTRLEEGCSLDWVLVTGLEAQALDSAFDVWWNSWRPDPSSGGEPR